MTTLLRSLMRRVPIIENTSHSVPDIVIGLPGENITAPTSRSARDRLIGRAFTLRELPSLIEAIFANEDEYDIIHSLLVDDAQTFIDVMDEALSGLVLSPGTRKKCLKLLYRVCGRHALLPRTLRIPVCYDRARDALYRSGFADVWKGKYRGQDVAVKVLRTYSNSDFRKIVGMFCEEVVMWKYLQHPNVLPLIGVTMTETRFAMISDWMINGNMNDFVRAHPDVDRFRLLIGVCEGLIYIHDQGMTHGDLKGANILIDQTGIALLADFGLLTIISDPASSFSSTSRAQGVTARWMSPELVNPQRFGLGDSRPTKSSDCYALGMVIYETISGKSPFYQHADLTVLTKVLAGEHPTREAAFTGSLWKMLKKCWKPRPNTRPSIEDVLHCLENVANSFTRHHRQQQGQQLLQVPDRPGPPTQHPISMYGPSITSGLYNPSDPATFPPNDPPSSVTYTTPGRNPSGILYYNPSDPSTFPSPMPKKYTTPGHNTSGILYYNPSGPSAFPSPMPKTYATPNNHTRNTYSGIPEV